MKKILMAISLAIMMLNADITLSKKLVDGDMNTDEYQLFVTNTMDVSLKGLEAREVFFGDAVKHRELYKHDTSNYTKQNIKRMSESLDLGWFKENISILTRDDENKGNYFKIVDYYENGILKTRLIKNILAVDELSKEEQEIIYSTTNDTSYHYTNKKARAVFLTSKELEKFNKGLK